MLRMLPFHSAALFAGLRWLRGKDWLINPTRRDGTPLAQRKI